MHGIMEMSMPLYESMLYLHCTFLLFPSSFSGSRELHTVLCRLLRGHVRAGDLRQAQRQCHGEEVGPHVPYRLWEDTGECTDVWKHKEVSFSVSSEPSSLCQVVLLRRSANEKIKLKKKVQGLCCACTEQAMSI